MLYNQKNSISKKGKMGNIDFIYDVIISKLHIRY